MNRYHYSKWFKQLSSNIEVFFKNQQAINIMKDSQKKLWLEENRQKSIPIMNNIGIRRSTWICIIGMVLDQPEEDLQWGVLWQIEVQIRNIKKSLIPISILEDNKSLAKRYWKMDMHLSNQIMNNNWIIRYLTPITNKLYNLKHMTSVLMLKTKKICNSKNVRSKCKNWQANQKVKQPKKKRLRHPKEQLQEVFSYWIKSNFLFLAQPKPNSQRLTQVPMRTVSKWQARANAAKS